MPRIKIIFLFLLIGLSSGAVSTYRQAKLQIVNSSRPLLLIQGESYEKEWKKVDSLDQKGLPESALTEVKKIYALAQKDNNGPQIIKSTIYTMKYNSYLKEDDYVIALDELNKMAATSAAPQKQVLHSLIAEVYWGYYQSNRYKFYGRTETVNFKNDDIRTWDLNTLFKKILYHYLLSLQEQNITKALSIESYKDILIEYREARKFRPTLFDFVAHRAIDFFKSTEFDVSRPAYAFRIDKAEFFGTDEVFVKQDITTNDSLSTKFFALKLLQQVTSFHQTDQDPSALITLELERLAFVKNYSTLPNKDTLYYAALKNLQSKYPKHESCSEVEYAIAQVHFEMGSKYDPLNTETGLYKWEKKKAWELCETTSKSFPRSYGSSLCKALQSQIDTKTLRIDVEDVLIPNKASRALIQSTNVGELHIRIVPVGWDFQVNNYDDLDVFVKKLTSMKYIHQWKVGLQDDGDKQLHKMEIKLPSLAKGAYLILASSDPTFKSAKNAVAWAPFGVSNLSYSDRKNHEDETYDFAVFDRSNGTPIKNVKAQIYYKEYNYKTRKYEVRKGESYLSDENGMFKVRTTGRDYRYMYVDLSTSDDRLNSDQQYYQYRPYRESQSQTTTHFFSDRMIYRPGQTIYFKGIRITTDENGENPKLRTNEPVSVTLYDFNYQKVADLTLQTNEYGTFSGSFIAPTGLMNGSMHITDGYGSHYFSVEEYKRPKFEVEFEPVAGVYKLGQVIKVKGLAKAYAGSNIDNAKVSFRVTRNAYFPYYSYRWRWFGDSYYGRSSQSEIAVGETKTLEDGSFEISFTAIGDDLIPKKYQPAFSYSITADVTDINGETRSGSSNVNVGYTAMVVSANIPSELKSSYKKKISISAQNLNGTPVNAEGTISIYRLKQPEQVFVGRRLEQPDRHELSKSEYYSIFPGELYEDELNPALWTKEKLVLEMRFDTRKKDSLLLKDLSSWEPGNYVAETQSVDSFGIKVTDTRPFVVMDERSKKAAFSEVFSVRQLSATCEPGDKAAFLLSAKTDGVQVLMEIEEKGGIVSKKWLKLNQEQTIVELPVEEKHRGNFGVHFTVVKNNRFFHKSFAISVPFTNKELDIEFETFRNKILPGSNEEWKLKIKGKKGEKLASELLLTMYDASLDAFASNYFYFQPYRYYYASKNWNARFGFSSRTAQVYQPDWNERYYSSYRQFDHLNWFGYQTYYYGYARYYRSKDNVEKEGLVSAGAVEVDEMSVAESPVREEAKKSVATGKALEDVPGVQTATTVSRNGNEQQNMAGEKLDGKEKDKAGDDLSNVKARKNLSETAFFFPQLQTDENGNVSVKFTAPEALTKWKILGLAHSKELAIGTIEKELVTQKELMIMPNEPRFFREGDKITFVAKVSNLSDKNLDGTAQLIMIDPISGKSVDERFENKNNIIKFSVKKGLSTPLSWNLSVPEELGAVSYKIVAKAGDFSDGEEMAVPILTNRMLVTESLPLPIRKAGAKNFTFTKLVNSGASRTLRHHKLTLEFTSNPAWYAIQAMPYMMEYPYECAEQVFSRFYANSIAAHVVNSSPKIKAVFEQWKSSSPEAFLSNLEKNQELKSLMLEETPWVLEAKNESERKKRVALLFDFNRMSQELNSALRKLQKMQVSNGGWPWFPGMPESRYITQHIITGMGHLDKLGVKNIREDRATWDMVQDGVRYLDARVVEDYEYIKKHYANWKTERYIGYDVIQYLYARSYFKDITMNKSLLEALAYYKEQAKKYWLDFNLYAQGMLALGANRFEMNVLAGDIVKSIRERSIRHEELGMYWKDNTVGYFWYQAPIETHALMIEMFDEVANDQESVEELKVWLLKNKQTSDWKTTKATAEACYALLLRGTNILENDEMVEIKMGDQVIDPKKMDVKTEAGTGYFKTSWSGDAIRPEMGSITLTKKNNGVAWGAVYWQYFEQLDKITSHETPLKLNKKLFLVSNSLTGQKMSPVDEKTRLEPGSRVRVRVELRVDRAMEYVHMKDMRASCFEPVNVFSSYKWQDGLGYFESTRDAATNFFFEYLPKGTHVFEYDLLVSHKGDFSNGITTIQCMYAPEFTSHSEGIRVRVGDK